MFLSIARRRVEDAGTRVDEKRAIREKLGYMERVTGKREKKGKKEEGGGKNR